MVSVKQTPEHSLRIGVVGTGYIARGYVLACQHASDISVSRILTRRPLNTLGDFPQAELATDSVADLIEHSDMVLECSGDVVHSTEIIEQVIQAGLPVVTMNAEFHVTTGSYFVDKGLLSEAEGDQPGCTAALQRDAEQMGFKTWVYGNVKGFQNLTPNLEEMKYWSGKQGISLPMVTASTDGTKLQFEQALMANFYGVDILNDGLTGIDSTDLDSSAMELGRMAQSYGRPISDYVIVAGSKTRVFLVAEHEDYAVADLQYMKMGDGPLYLLEHGRNLCHFEINKTVRQLRDTATALLHNGNKPSVSVATVAKHDLASGTTIKNGVGSFDVRGTSVRIKEHQGHVPIGLLHDARLVRPVEAGQVLTWDDIELPDTRAREIWRTIENQACSR